MDGLPVIGRRLQTKLEAEEKSLGPLDKKIAAAPPVITLRLLIEHGLLSPGPEVLSLEYKGLVTTGCLNADGRIEYDGARQRWHRRARAARMAMRRA
jgi:hypothetical protein